MTKYSLAYEANLQEITNKWKEFIELNIKTKYKLDFLKPEDYWFTLQLFEYFSDKHNIYIDSHRQRFKEMLKYCIDNNITNLAAAKFVIDTADTMNAKL